MCCDFLRGEGGIGGGVSTGKSEKNMVFHKNNGVSLVCDKSETNINYNNSLILHV